jgi:hypothetical protein
MYDQVLLDVGRSYPSTSVSKWLIENSEKLLNNGK